MTIIIANPPAILDSGKYTVLCPSRSDWIGDYKPFSYYPYELAYLSALIKRELPQRGVIMLDGNLLNLNMEQYTRLIHTYCTDSYKDVLITECSHLSYSTMTKINRHLKGMHRGLTSVMLGPVTTFMPDQLFAGHWDTFFVGEYEAKVLAWLKGEKEPEGRIDLDWLPFPEDRDVCRMDYGESNSFMGAAQLYATRGCPLSCVYCNVPLYHGGHGNSYKSHRTRNVENVCDEIEYLAQKYPSRFRGCFFNDDAHDADPVWLAEFASALIQKGLNRYYHEATCGYWTLTKDLIQLLRKAGYIQLRIGLESLSPVVGKRIGKRVDPDKLYQILVWMKEVGIRSYLFTMVGAPGSTEQIDLDTLNTLKKWKEEGLLGFVQHSICTPYPGTAFFQEALEEGWLNTDDISQYNWANGVVDYPDYPASKINEMSGLYYGLREG
jgi:radical SAM superfamily enzyme YgiQ (UPF0313 family)